MKTKKLWLVLSLLLVFVVGITIPVLAASTVTESDWIAAPSNPLVKCEGGDCDHTACDYVYSFAIIGDTQNLNYKDAQNYVTALANDPTLTYANYTQAYMRTLYNWILNKQEELNIQYVMGVGDITQSFNTSQTYYDEEWPLAKEAISLLDGKLGYSLVRGNHDISAGLNAQFGVGTTYYNDLVALSQTTDAEGRPMGGFRLADKIEDSYRKIVAGNNKYIIFTLEYYPTEETVAWLNELLAANSDYTAIVTLHCFLNRDCTFVDPHETTTPDKDAAKENWAQTATGGNVPPADLWKRVLSKHANVQMVISGHIDVDDVLINKMQGDNGNTVTFMLTDTQTIDSTTPVGVVTMLYFSADGKVAHVEHISTVRDAAGQNAYLKESNQFTLDLDYSENGESGWTSTEYGSIPTEQYNAHTFHILLDDNGDGEKDSFHCGSFDNLTDAFNYIDSQRAVGTLASRMYKNYNIVMSKDYTNTVDVVNTITRTPGVITLDLNGNTLTNSKRLVAFYNRYDTYDPSFVLKNGNIVQTGSGPIVALQTSGDGIKTASNFRLEDLNISYGSKGSGQVITCFKGVTSEGSEGKVDVTVSNCTVDTTGTSNSVTIFNLADELDNNDVTLTFNGLTVKGTTAANTVLYTKNSDTFLALPDENGNALTISLTAANSYNEIFAGAEGGYYVFAPSEKDGRYIYTLAKSELEETPYGLIDATQYPATQYPFALFNSNGFVKAYKTYYAFLDDIKTNVITTDSTLLLRTNWNTTNDGKNSSNLNCLRAHLTIDLNNKTITRGSYHLFQMIGKDGVDISITIKNGTVVSGSALSPIVFNDSKTDGVEHITVRVENVTFKPSTSTAKTIFIASYDDGTQGVKGEVIFDNCVFDLTGVKNGSKLFQLLDNKFTNKNDISVKINGGEFKAKTFNYTFADFDEPKTEGGSSPDSIRFGEYNGSYTKFTATSASSAPAIEPAAVNGEKIAFYNGGTDSAPVYYLVPLTEYGKIPYEWVDETKYPFVLFVNGNDTAVYASATWSEMLTKATTYLKSDSAKATILVRANASEGSANHASAAIRGTLVVDLDDHTLTIPQFLFKLNKTGKYDTNIEVKNGNLSFSGSGYLIYFGSGATESNGATGYGCNVTFSKVNIGYAKGATGLTVGTSYTTWIRNMAASGKLLTVGNVRFEDCVLDFKTNAPSSKPIVFADLAGDAECHSANIVIDGGEIIYPTTASNLILFNLKDSTTAPDTFKFSNSSTGKYPVISVSGSVPTDKFDTEEGYKAMFGKVGDGYTLVPAEFKILGAYLNIQENINVCYVVGVPAGYTAPYMVFEFNGNKYTVNEYTVDATGKLIFKFVGVVPQMLGENIKATLYATNGEGVEESFEVAEYSVKTYCVNMLAKTTDAKLRTLLSDLLVYGAKAQLYNNPNLAESELVTYGLELTPSEFIAPETSAKKLDGTADDSVVWNSVALRYENAMAIKLNFKVSADYTLKISINGRESVYNVNELGKEGDNYVVYFRGIEATEYAMVLTATFYSAEGTQVGQSAQYSVNSYVFSKQNDTDKALSELVKATYNYGISAENYVK